MSSAGISMMGARTMISYSNAGGIRLHCVQFKASWLQCWYCASLVVEKYPVRLGDVLSATEGFYVFGRAFE
jgi:hypothetical protein